MTALELPISGVGQAALQAVDSSDPMTKSHLQPKWAAVGLRDRCMRVGVTL